MFQKIKKFNLPELESQVLDFWKEINVFKKLEEKEEGKKKFVFYEGPPTANGEPGIHHVLARVFKDIVLRYKSMRGHDVTRKAGWDTHGLPVELEVEKSLGFNSKEEIEEYGVEKFNQKCRESVWKYQDDWEKLTERIGFWIDMERPYITYENSYMESVWWILNRLWEKGLLYKGYKVVNWCPRCGTGLSSHELALGYETITETSVYVKFKVKDREDTYILSWTTTSWTLPGNVALAVGEDIDYVVLKSKDSGEKYILADSRRGILEGEYEEVERMKGRDLVGMEYISLFEVKMFKGSDTAYRVYPANFVTTNEGTGVVHTAVMYGEDDYRLGREVGLPEKHTVDEKGRFVDGVPGLGGRKVKEKETEEKIFKYLKNKNFLLRTEEYTHEYPHCWRCGTPILYYGRESWFITMTELRKKLVSENERINWIPEHVKEGRFGEWIAGAKDWALSRDRYWGTPLPIWECEKCGERVSVGSFAELDRRLGGVKNEYVLMRHGEAESNTKGVINSDPEKKNLYGLTEKGRREVEGRMKELKKIGVDLIFSSDFRRVKETAEMVSRELGVEMKTDERLREVNTGELDGRPEKEYHGYFSELKEKIKKRPEGGENLRDVAKRVSDFLEEMEEKYKGRKILIVSHDYPLWMTESVMRGWNEDKAVWVKGDKEKEGKKAFIETGEARKVNYMKLPRNMYGFADIHRPYVDNVTFTCPKCGGRMKRVSEVIDVWFDSGSMPFAQHHFPFKQKSGLLRKTPDPKREIDFPADYISEGQDQTRGWFYTLLAISTLLGYEGPYKNVISLGLVLDKYGRKMSKSKGNVIDPWEAVRDFGADAIRWHFYTANPPGEPKKFDDEEIRKVLRNFIFLLYNSFSFLDLYTESVEYDSEFKPKGALDKWIISRLNETVKLSEEALDGYDIGGAGRVIETLVDDLSRWHIRRSRRRLQKPETEDDFRETSLTLGYVLLQISKIAAPFIPFVSEALYQSLRKKMEGYEFKDSVHLEDWPKGGKVNEELEKKMRMVREAASTALSIREEAGIKVKQPLAELAIAKGELEGEDELLNLLKEEVNVKRVRVDKGLKESVLDMEITSELREEGRFRELVRMIQKGRQDAGLGPRDRISLGVEGNKDAERLVSGNAERLKREVRADEIHTKSLRRYDLNFETDVGGYKVRITLQKK